MQANAGGPKQGLVASPAGLEVLLLRAHQRRRVDLEQGLTGCYLVSPGFDVQFFDPAVGANVHMGDAPLVGCDKADSLDLAIHVTAFNGRHLDANVVDDRRIDPDRGFLPAVLPGFIGINGDQVHAHRGFAGLIAPVIGIHGGDPVEDLALGLLRLLRVAGRGSGKEPGGREADCSSHKGYHDDL